MNDQGLTPDQIQHLGAIGVVALIVGFVIRLLKTNKINSVLAYFKLPPIPKPALPWIAAALGGILFMLHSKSNGFTWSASISRGALGLLSGFTAISGNEMLVEGMKALVASQSIVPILEPEAVKASEPDGTLAKIIIPLPIPSPPPSDSVSAVVIPNQVREELDKAILGTESKDPSKEITK